MLRRTLLVCTFLIFSNAGFSPAFGIESARIGIVHYSQPSPNAPIVEPTIEAIKEKLRGKYETEILDLPLDKLEEAVKKGEVDLFLSSAGFYRRLVHSGARDLATAMNPSYRDPNNSEGSAIVVRADRDDLNSINSLKNQTLAVASKNTFTGFHIPMGEIATTGEDPFKFFKEIKETGSRTNTNLILQAIKNGKADVGFIRQCALETYLKQHPQDLRTFKVIAPKNIGQECLRSTDLYPTWTLGSTKSATPELSRLVTSAVLDMPETKDGFLWGVSTDYNKVDELFKQLKIGPYSYLREWTVKRFIREYWTVLSLVAFFIFGLILHSWRVEQLVNKRTLQLTNSLAALKQAQRNERAATSRMETLQKIGVVNQLSSIFAHEMRQPLGTTALYLEALQSMTQDETIDKSELTEIVERLKKQNDRANSIVDRVRAYRKRQPKRDELLNLHELLVTSVETLKQSMPEMVSMLTVKGDEVCPIYGDALEIELLILNLIKNSLEAIKNQKNGHVIVETGNENGKSFLIVKDNGNLSSEKDLDSLSKNFETTKKNGLGLGLAIVKGIIEQHGGSICFSLNTPHGILVRVNFPRAS